MAAPVSFRERSDSFPLHCGRRPYLAHRVESLRCEGSDAIGAKRACRERRERVDLTKMTPSRHSEDEIAAAQNELRPLFLWLQIPDLINGVSVVLRTAAQRASGKRLHHNGELQ